MKRIFVVVAFFAMLVSAFPNAASGQDEVTVTSVATGLDNPRKMSIGPDGTIFVSTAGHGGKHCVKRGGGEICAGFTAKLYSLSPDDDAMEVVHRGLASSSDIANFFTVGSSDVDVADDGTIYTVVSPDLIPKLDAAKPQRGKLLRVDSIDTRTSLANILKFERDNNPEPTFVDSNAHGVAVIDDGWLVADAGGNDLLKVDEDGNISVVAVFFNRRFGDQEEESDQVATTVEVGPDGAYYVGTLGGVGTPKDTTRVYRVQEGEDPTVFADGLTLITSIAFGPDGSLYVTELVRGGWGALFRGKTTGSLIKITPEGERTEIAAGQLDTPGGVVVTDDGVIYVTVNSIFSGSGEVVKIEETP